MSTNHFVLTDDVYLLSHSVGRPMVGAKEHTEKYFFDQWEQTETEVWNKWLPAIDSFRAALAKLYNVNQDEICPQVNLSSALSKIISSLELIKSKNTIVYCEEDFPSIGFVLQMAERHGYQLRCIPKAEQLQSIDVWDKYLKDDVGIVLISHVYSNTGVQSPVSQISHICRTRNIMSIVDVAQSAGVIPINIRQWACDFVIGSSVKWLCGGPGAAYLWVNPAILNRCKPLDVGWFSHQNPFEFDIHHFEYASTALRFWGGTPSVMPYVLASYSINILDNIGINEVRQNNNALNELIIDHVPEQYLVSPRDVSERGGTLILNFADQEQAVINRLEPANVRFDSRPYGIRLSPHIYNTEQDIGVVLDCLSSVSN